MNPLPLPLLALLPLVALLPSCSTLVRSDVVPPNVAVVGMQLADVQLMETAVSVNIRIENENPEPILVTGGVHKVYVDGEFIGKALDNHGCEVPPLGSVNHTVIANVSNLKLATRLGQVLNTGDYDYEIQSTVYASISDGRPRRFRVSKAGNVNLQGLGFGPRPPVDRPVRARPVR